MISHRQHDGFVRNTLLNKDENDENKTSFRGQLLLGLDNSEWILSADYTRDERDAAGRFPFVSPLASVAESFGANRPQTNAAPIEGFSDRETYGLSLSGEYNFDTGSLISISGFRNVQAD